MSVNKISITRVTDCYNERRYGKPWLAFVDFEANKKGNFHFQEWIGEKGFAGLFDIEVFDGQIIATGQKDYRKQKNSAPNFFIVRFDGENVEFVPVSKKDAYLHYMGGVQ